MTTTADLEPVNTTTPPAPPPRPPRYAPSHRIVLTAEAPLHHGAFGGDAGNAVLFRRVPIASYPDSSGVPAISGNALRGALRRIVMRDLLMRCDLTVATYSAAGLSASQWDRLYAALANGGHLDGSETKTDPVRIRQVRDTLPALSVFGAALYTWMLPGLVSLGWSWPRCVETVSSGLVPADVAVDQPLVPGEALLTEITLVRHIDRDEQDPTSSGVTPMPVTVEALMPGTTLVTSLIAMRRMSDVELGVMGYGLSLLRTLGGKAGSGFGRMRVVHDVPDEPYVGWLADPERIAAAREMLLTIARSAGK
ncbi:MAG: hypothetical protein RJA99_4257 [Pseudomonadota bacterium]|jgi:hypothetical protein